MEKQPNQENAEWRAEDGKETEFSEESSAGLENEIISPDEQIEELKTSFKESEDSAHDIEDQIWKANDKTREHWRKTGGEYDRQDLALIQTLKETHAVHVSQMVETMRHIMKETLKKDQISQSEFFRITSLGIRISNAQGNVDGLRDSKEEALGPAERQGFDAEMVQNFSQITKKATGEDTSQGDLVDLLTSRMILPENPDEATIKAALKVTDHYDLKNGLSRTPQSTSRRLKINYHQPL